MAATMGMQQAARDVAIENSRLRLLLVRSGFTNEDIDSFLQTFNDQDDVEVQEAGAAMVELAIAPGRIPHGNMSSSSSEASAIDKLAVLASASVQQGCGGGDMHYAMMSDDATTAPSTGPVTPALTAVNASSGDEQDFGSPLEMSSSAAAEIIAQMQAYSDGKTARHSIESDGKGECLVRNAMLLQILEAASASE